MGQCLEIFVADTLQICSAEETQLEAIVNGVVLRSEWTPSIGLDNAIKLQPTIIAPLNTAYTVQIIGFNENDNLLSNGDFSEGNIGFTSDYKEGSTDPGGYVIGLTSTEILPMETACLDHSTPEGGGNMFLSKVMEGDDIEIYCQEVNVKPGQDYHFRGFATSIIPNFPPTLVLKINEETKFVASLDAFACSWQEIISLWNAGTATTAKICISVGGGGSTVNADFALDDLGFYEVCTIEKSIEVKVVPFDVNLEKDTMELPCGEHLQLNAVVTPNGLDFLTEWNTTDGNIVADEISLAPTIDAPGLYEVEVQAIIDTQFCTAKKRIQINVIIKDSLTIAPPENLHCQQSHTVLTAIDTVNPADFLYQWTTTNGNIVSNKDAQIITVDKAGKYLLQRTDLFGECRVLASVEVVEETINDFLLEVVPSDCTTSENSILFREINGGKEPFHYSIDSGLTFQPVPFFGDIAAGNYALIVKDANDCQFEKNVSLSDVKPLHLNLPVEIIIKDSRNFQIPLTINQPETFIEKIEWQPSTGLSCPDCLNPILLDQQSQIYQVKITDINGCIVQARTQIIFKETSDVYFPTAFSPNGDGTNDIFIMFANEKTVKKIKQFSIFDRMGSLVFEQADFLPNAPSIGWNGQFKGQRMPVGTYVYWAELEMKHGRMEIFKGTIDLLRNE